MKYIKCNTIEECNIIDNEILIILKWFTDSVGERYCVSIKHKTEEIWLIPIEEGIRQELILSIPDITIIELNGTEEEYFDKSIDIIKLKIN